jgi:phosphoribosylformimino-5-aminoimidazole carboxamide ribotide isomerase
MAAQAEAVIKKTKAIAVKYFKIERMFVVIPAIDLLENNAVRLVQGDYTHSTTYSNNAIELSKKFETSGTKRLHIVDLGGAKSGRPEHFELIKQIRQNTTMQIEVGGGIRDIETVEKYFKAGINYLILGSMLLKNKPLAVRSSAQRP